MFRYLALAALASSLLVQAADAAVQAAPQPSDPPRWHLDGATNRCVLTRPLDGSPVPATFILRTIPASNRYELILASGEFPEPIRALRGRSALKLALDPVLAAVDVPAGWTDLPGALGDGLVIWPLPGELLDAIAQSRSISIADAQGREQGRWSVPAAARAAEALRYCEREKLAEWGADPAGLEAGASGPQPQGDSRQWLTPRLLGLSDVLGSLSYTAVFRLHVGNDGRVGECELLESAGNADLTSACRVLKRVARYRPARSAAGVPVASIAIHVVDVRLLTELRIVPG